VHVTKRLCSCLTFFSFSALCFGQGLHGKAHVSSDFAAAVVANAANPWAIYNIIVQYNLPPTAAQRAAVRRLSLSSNSDIDLSAIDADYLTVNTSAIEGLVNNPNIAWISLDRELKPMLDIDNSATGAGTAYSYGFTGSGVGVAVIDSGVLMPQADLASSSNKSVSRVVYSQSFVPKLTGTSDQYGHGTHVAGVVAGNGANSTGAGYTKTFRGIAPNANIINLRVLDVNGVGTDSAVISAISAAIKLKQTYNIRVINLSLGRPVYESYALDPLCQAVEKAWQAGIVVVVAAGNDGRNNSMSTSGYGTITAPANDPYVITVGAMKNVGTMTRLDDLIASYSSKGPSLIDHVVKPDLVAPGNRTISLLAAKALLQTKSTSANLVPNSYYQSTTSTSTSANYFRLSGTSMAAPIVSGAAALMIGRDPSLTPDTVKARLMLSATKSFPLYSTAIDSGTSNSYTSQYDIFSIGAGYVDVWAALNSTATVPPGMSAVSPTAILNAATNTVSLTASALTSGAAAVWGSGSVFGAAAVWGSSVFVDSSAAVWGSDTSLWGTAAVWGSGTLSGNAAIWGSAAVWGSGTSDGSESISLIINGEN